MTFSSRESGPVPRDISLVDESAWSGVVVILHQAFAANLFAHSFPRSCPDQPGTIVGTDEKMLALAVADRLKPMRWPIDADSAPSTPRVMDVLEFAFRVAAEPRIALYHGFFGHPHLAFDVRAGQAGVRRDANELFGRHGLAFEMGSRGLVKRLGPPVISELLFRPIVTGDEELDRLLARAVQEIQSPQSAGSTAGIEALWDAWERLKSVPRPGDKRASVAELISNAASDEATRLELQADARTLTSIGNSFRIRHHEVGKHAIRSARDADYLFVRMLNLILRLAPPS
jgi:hypothetical protein